MRVRELILSLLAAVALTLGACTVSVNEGEGEDAAAVGTEAEPGGWTLAVIGDDPGPKTFLLVRPDGLQAAAEIAGGVSRIVDAGDVAGAVSDSISEPAPTGGEQVRIKAPLLDVQVNEDATGEKARVSVNAGGRAVDVRADDASGTAVVRIAGASQSDARKFIDDAAGLSPEVKQQLKAQLGL